MGMSARGVARVARAQWPPAPPGGGHHFRKTAVLYRPPGAFTQILPLLVLEPRLDEAGVHDMVERLVSPMKVAWRRVERGKQAAVA